MAFLGQHVTGLVFLLILVQNPLQCFDFFFILTALFWKKQNPKKIY
jgi:hypothetical protein